MLLEKSVLKSRNVTLRTKVCRVRGTVFPIVMHRCESWTIKKAECQKLDAFEPWCWRRLLRVPWTARRSNQSVLKETDPEYSLEGLMLKLKPQYFGHLMQRAESVEKTLTLGKTEGRRSVVGRGNKGWDGWMASQTQWTKMCTNSNKQWRTGKPGTLQSRGSHRRRYDFTAEQQQCQFKYENTIIHVNLLQSCWTRECAQIFIDLCSMFKMMCSMEPHDNESMEVTLSTTILFYREVTSVCRGWGKKASKDSWDCGNWCLEAGFGPLKGMLFPL